MKKASERLAKLMFDLGADEGEDMTPFHGWISPEGKHHKLEPHERHDGWLKSQGMEEHQAYSKGWVGVGHGGEPNLTIPHHVFHDKNHPANRAVRRFAMSKDFPRKAVVEIKGKGAQSPYFEHADMKHFGRTGELREPGKEMKPESEIKKSVSTTDEDAHALMNRMERKFFLNRKHLPFITNVLSDRLALGDIDTDARYNVNRTIYLDDADLSSFKDCIMRVKPRSKIRIRQYSPNGKGWEKVAYAEFKIKEEDGQTHKLRVRFPAELVDALCEGGFLTLNEELVNLNKDIDREVLERRVHALNKTIERKGLRKQIEIRYERRAYSGKDIRITIDDSLLFVGGRAIDPMTIQFIQNLPAWEEFYEPYAIADWKNPLILEVKSSEDAPKWIEHLLDETRAKEMTFSKYCAAMASMMKTGKSQGLITGGSHIKPEEGLGKSEVFEMTIKSVDRLKELMDQFNEELAKAEDKPFHGYSKEKHARTGGLNAKYREKYNRETGSHLKAPVTEKNPTGKQAARKKSFCARMSGVKGPTSKDGKLTPKGAALKRWRCSKCEDIHKDEGWLPRPKSEDYTHLGHTFHEVEHPNTPDGHKAYHVISPKGEKDIIFARNVGEVGKYLSQSVKKSAMDILKDLEKRCWEGYEPTPGKKPYSKGSCQPVKKEEAAPPKPTPADYGLKQKPFAEDTAEGKKLAAIGGKVQAIKELQEKNPHIDWKSIIKTMSLGHSMGGTMVVGGAAISKSEILEILRDLLDA